MTNHNLQKLKMHRTVRETAKLYDQNKIPKEVLQAIAASAMAWEISTILTGRMKEKQKKFVKKIESISDTAS